MGANQSLPLPCWEHILSFLPIQDVVQLTHVDEETFELIRKNSYFWRKRAQQFHDLDSMLFTRFKDTSGDKMSDLAPAVVRADAALEVIKSGIEIDAQTIRSYPMDDEVMLMSVDQREGRVVVQLLNKTIRVYNLERMVEGPLHEFQWSPLREIILHGPLIFMRDTYNPVTAHTDIYSWADKEIMAHLGPGSTRVGAAPLKKSDDHLLAYDIQNHAALAYPLRKTGFCTGAHVVKLPNETSLHDYAIRKNVVYTILAIGGVFFFQDFLLPTGDPIRKLAIATPTERHEPKLKYPYILITQRPFAGDSDRRNIGVYGTRIWVPGAYARVETGTTIVADDMVEPVSCSEYFLFLRDFRRNRILVLRLGDMETPFRVVDQIGADNEETVIASYGLSFVHRHGRRLIIRSYTDAEFR